MGGGFLHRDVARPGRPGYGRLLISIVFSEGPLAGQRLELDREMTVGRDEGCDITLNDREVSRRHLLLRPAGGELGVEDLGSTNGTVVDGQQIAGAVNLADGGVVNIGTSEFIVQVVAAVPEEQRTAASPMPVAETATTGGPPAWFWTLTGLVEIGLILTAATLLVYYAVR